ncbi:hypothetical protein FXO38_12029 [Capsicum annuum]|nr:hypothetical protein FXO38_12029 [Capsicum annuum]
MLPTVSFIFSRNGCEVAIQYLEDCRLLDECKTSEVELPLKRFCIQYPNVVRVSPLKASIKEWLHDKCSKAGPGYLYRDVLCAITISPSQKDVIVTQLPAIAGSPCRPVWCDCKPKYCDSRVVIVNDRDRRHRA